MTSTDLLRTLLALALLCPAACRGAATEPQEALGEVAALPEPIPFRVQAPAPAGPQVMLAAVSLQDQMSGEEIAWLLAAHGVAEGDVAGGGGYTFAVAESQAGFAADLLRRDGPRRGRWSLPHDAGEFRPVGPPPEGEWAEHAAGVSFDEALRTHAEGTPAGALLRHPVVRAYGRMLPRVRSLRAFTRVYRDAELQPHEGLDGTIELDAAGDGEEDGRVQFMAFFQAWEAGARVELIWWDMAMVEETDRQLDERPVPIAGANTASPSPVEWMLRTSQHAGVAAAPLPGTPRPQEQAYRLFGVPAADAAKARSLLRTDRPAWATIDVLGD